MSPTPTPSVPYLLDRLRDAIRQEMADQVVAALGQSNGHIPGQIPSHKPSKPPRKRQAARSRQVRPSASAVLTVLQSHPGASSEVLQRALRTDAKRLRPVLLELVRTRKVRRTGVRRGVRYEAR